MAFASTALRDQLSLSTWLLIGAGVQTCALAAMPAKYVGAITLGGLAFLCTRTALQTFSLVKFNPSPPITPGRFTARPPASPDPQPIVVFILGFNSCHPLGKLAPGVKEVGDYFNGIMDEAKADKGSSGFLGSTSFLTMDGAADNAFMTLSYWCELDKLEKFSKTGVHAKAMKWWNEAAKKYPYLGKWTLGLTATSSLPSFTDLV